MVVSTAIVSKSLTVFAVLYCYIVF